MREGRPLQISSTFKHGPELSHAKLTQRFVERCADNQAELSRRPPRATHYFITLLDALG
jgi:hypothetical protein